MIDSVFSVIGRNLKNFILLISSISHTFFIDLPFWLFYFSILNQFTLQNVSFAQPIIFSYKLLNFFILNLTRTFLFSDSFRVFYNIISLKMRYFFLYHFRHDFQVIFKMLRSDSRLKIICNVPIFFLLVIVRSIVFSQ